MASTEEDAINMMLQALTKHHKKLLITIDEVTYNNDIAKFSHAMSSYATAGYDAYVLMTGLKENINSIKNKPSLTFLYRAKVEELDRLNLITIKNSYKKVMKLDDNIASELAHISGGYSLAFQALGYHYWNELCRIEDGDEVDMDAVIDELDATLSELAYDKIWSELSRNDRQILIAMSRLRQVNKSCYNIATVTFFFCKSSSSTISIGSPIPRQSHNTPKISLVDELGLSLTNLIIVVLIFSSLDVQLTTVLTKSS